MPLFGLLLLAIVGLGVFIAYGLWCATKAKGGTKPPQGGQDRITPHVPNPREFEERSLPPRR